MTFPNEFRKQLAGALKRTVEVSAVNLLVGHIRETEQSTAQLRNLMSPARTWSRWMTCTR